MDPPPHEADHVDQTGKGNESKSEKHMMDGVNGHGDTVKEGIPDGESSPPTPTKADNKPTRQEDDKDESISSQDSANDDKMDGVGDEIINQGATHEGGTNDAISPPMPMEAEDAKSQDSKDETVSSQRSPDDDDDKLPIKKRPKNMDKMRDPSLESYAQKWSELASTQGRADEGGDFIVPTNETSTSISNTNDENPNFQSLSDEFSSAILRNSVTIRKDTSITGKWSGGPREEPHGFVPSTEEACKKGIYEVVKPSFQAYQTDGSTGPSYDPEKFNLMLQQGHVPSTSLPYPGSGMSLGAAAGTRAVLLSSITNMMSQRQAATQMEGQIDGSTSNIMDMEASLSTAQHDDNFSSAFADTSMNNHQPALMPEKGIDNDTQFYADSTSSKARNSNSKRKRKSKGKGDHKTKKRNRRKEGDLTFSQSTGIRKSKRSPKEINRDIV